MTLEDKIKMDRISQKYLRECLLYDPDDGTFTWRNRPLSHFRNVGHMNRVNSRLAGKLAGTYSKSQNMTYLMLDRKKFRAAKLAVIHFVGQIGAMKIICVNGDGSDIRITNLKAAKLSHLASTTRPWIHGKAGTTGITRTKHGTYEARIHREGRCKFLGTGKTIDEAIAIREQGMIDYGIRKQTRRMIA